jgi:hypothetical protein
MTTPTIIDAARRITAQLDARGNHDLTGLPETLCRALKVPEEAGEMAQAVIGVLGQNPRKGVTHSWDDVVAEAIDTALSALVLAETVQPGMLDLTLAGRLDFLDRRAAASGAADIHAPQRPAVANDDADLRMAATLRWLLAASDAHGLALPEGVRGNSAGYLYLNLSNDRPDDVPRWAALLGATVAEPREARHGGNQWVTVEATTPYGANPAGLGWTSIDISTVCDYRPITAEPSQAVAA